MPGIRIADINVAGLTVGQVIPLKLPFGTYLPATLKQNSEGSAAILRIWNESGVGFDYVQVGGVDTGSVCAGGWYDIELDHDVQQINFTVSYILPNAPVSLLKSTYYLPGQTPPLRAILGNSPIGGAVVNLTANNLINQGNPAGTNMVQGSSSPAAGSIIINNDGSGSRSLISNGVTEVLESWTEGTGLTEAAVVYGASTDYQATNFFGEFNGYIKSLNGVATTQAQGGNGVPAGFTILLESHVTATSIQTLFNVTITQGGLYRFSGYITMGNNLAEPVTYKVAWQDLLYTGHTTTFIDNANQKPLNGANNIGPTDTIPLVTFTVLATAGGNLTVTYQDPAGTPNDFVSLYIEYLS
jgi:hypothetical protein